MGGKTQKTTSTSAPPAYITDAYKSLLSRAGDVSNTAYNPATQQQYQGINATQQQAFGATQGAQGIQSPYLGQAADWTQQGVSPVSSADISQYLNPYQSDVINATMANIGHNNAVQQSSLTGNAALRGALGGDRVGVAQAELARNQDQNTNSILAQLNSQNYSQALGAAQADKSRAFTGAGISAGLGQQAQGAAYTDINALLGIGGQQQQEAQRAADIGTANAQQQAQYPFNTTQWLAGITQGLGSSAGGTQTTTAPGPSVLGQVAGLGLTAAGIASGFPGLTSTLGTVASGMFGGSRNLSGLATGGMVTPPMGASPSGQPMVNGKPIDSGIHSKLLNLHHATMGMGAIKRANGGELTAPGARDLPRPGFGEPDAGPSAAMGGIGFAAGGLPGEDDDMVDEPLWGGLLQQESGDQDIEGPLVLHGANAGDRAQGPTQVMPKTAADPGYGVRPLDPNAADPKAENYRLGHDYLNAMLHQFGGDKEAALIAYNAGPANAQKWLASGRDYGVLPDRAQTEPYVRNILGGMGQQQTAAASGAPTGIGVPSLSSPAASSPAAEETSGINYPLLAAGLGMLASKSPFPGVAIGEGGLQGVQEMLKQKALDRQVNALHQQMAIAQQRLGIQNEGLAERQRHNLELEKKYSSVTDKPIIRDIITNPVTGEKQTQQYNKATNVWEPLQGPQGAAGAQQGTDISNLHGDDLLQALPPETAALVKKFGNYELPPPSGIAMRKMAPIMALTEQYKPGFSAQEYATQLGLKKSFTSGKDADEIKSYNTVMGHAIKAYDAIDALGNTGSSWMNAPYNAVRGQTSASFQRARSTMLNELDTAVAEYNRATTGKPITVEEHRAMHERLGQNAGPEDLKSTLSSFAGMVKSRMEASANKWNAGMRLQEGDPGYKTPDVMLNPQAKKDFERMTALQQAAMPQTAADPTQPSVSKGVPQKVTKSQYDALPPGTDYIAADDPSGTVRTKK